MDITDQSFLLSIIIVLFPFVLISTTVMAISRKIMRRPFMTDGELRGLSTISSVIGGLFGLLLGLMVVSLWQDYKSLQAKTIEEAASINILYAEAEEVGGADGDSLKMLTEQYLDAVINDAWPLMQRGEESKKTPIIFAKLLKYTLKISNDENVGNAFIKEDMLERLVTLSTLRKERIFYSSNPRVPNDMWIVLIIGAILTILSTFLFPFSKTKTQFLLTTLHSGMIGLVIFLILCLDHPFSGAISIDSEPFKRTQKTIERLKKINVSIPQMDNRFF